MTYLRNLIQIQTVYSYVTKEGQLCQPVVRSTAAVTRPCQQDSTTQKVQARACPRFVTDPNFLMTSTFYIDHTKLVGGQGRRRPGNKWGKLSTDNQRWMLANWGRSSSLAFTETVVHSFVQIDRAKFFWFILVALLIFLDKASEVLFHQANSHKHHKPNDGRKNNMMFVITNTLYC